MGFNKVSYLPMANISIYYQSTWYECCHSIGYNQGSNKKSAQARSRLIKTYRSSLLLTVAEEFQSHGRISLGFLDNFINVKPSMYVLLLRKEEIPAMFQHES